MHRIKHTLFLLATFTLFGAQEADTAAVSTEPAQADTAAVSALPAQTDTAAVAAAPEKELPTVAVLDFEVNGLPDYEVETLVERLRSTVSNTGQVRLLDRKILEKILQEQGLQQSGCTTDVSNPDHHQSFFGNRTGV